MEHIIRREPQITGMVEITRSFTYKLNRGNYESSDFFMAQKAECQSEDAEVISEKLYQFCKKEVMRAVSEYQRENPIQSTRRTG